MRYVLNKDQIKHWEEKNYLMLDNFLSEDIKKKLPTWCAELTAWPETPGKWMKYFEINTSGERQLCRIENFIDYHKAFGELVRGDYTLHLLSDLMGEDAVIFKEKINYKFPNGKGFAPHQDAPAFVSFNQKFHVTMMIAIDDCTIENGCLQVAKGGSKRYAILPQEKDGSIRKDYVEKIIWEPLVCAQGTVILFDSYLPHYSESNRSLSARNAIFATYNKASEGGSKRTDYYQDKREKFPPDCERDPTKDYSKGAAIYNIANPITTK